MMPMAKRRSSESLGLNMKTFPAVIERRRFPWLATRQGC